MPRLGAINHRGAGPALMYEESDNCPPPLDVTALLTAGRVDEAWARISDWAEAFLGITDPAQPRSRPWHPRPRLASHDKPGSSGHEPPALGALRKLSYRLAQLQHRPWDRCLFNRTAASLRRTRHLAPDLPHLDLENPELAAAMLQPVLTAHHDAHRRRCLERWRQKVTTSVEDAVTWVKHRAEQECRLQSNSPLEEAEAYAVHPVDRVEQQGEIWTRKWQLADTPPDVEDFPRILQELPRHTQSDVDLTPSPEELRRAMAKMKKKAPGPDNWTGALLLRMPPNWWRAFSALWRTILQQGRVPAIWQRSLVVLLDKGPSSTRPIALLSIAWRAGAQAISRRLKGWIYQWCSPRACGSAPGRCTADMHQRILRAWRKGVRSYVQQDLTSFFDSLSMPIVTTALKHFGAPHSLIRLVSGFYASQFRLFVVQSCTSARWQRAHTGLLQGCPLSPTLSLCIGYLWSAFVASPQVEAGIYVDDRIMWVSQLSQDATTAAGLMCSQRKCHLVTDTHECPWRLLATARGYEVVSSLKFLGIELDLTTGCTSPLKLCLEKLQIRLRYAGNPAFSLAVRTKVIRSLVYPALHRRGTQRHPHEDCCLFVRGAYPRGPQNSGWTGARLDT